MGTERILCDFGLPKITVLSTMTASSSMSAPRGVRSRLRTRRPLPLPAQSRTGKKADEGGFGSFPS